MASIVTFVSQSQITHRTKPALQQNSISDSLLMVILIPLLCSFQELLGPLEQLSLALQTEDITMGEILTRTNACLANLDLIANEFVHFEIETKH